MIEQLGQLNFLDEEAKKEKRTKVESKIRLFPIQRSDRSARPGRNVRTNHVLSGTTRGSCSFPQCGPVPSEGLVGVVLEAVGMRGGVDEGRKYENEGEKGC